MKPSARLKVNGDTFFLPDANGGVYFRNNLGSFRMEGETIDQWIELLIPVLDGKHTMEELTDGLPDPHKDRLNEIAESLYRRGFVRDVSQDAPHQLPDPLLDKYGSQIEFLDSFGGSGAFRFQAFRQAKVLAIGSGPFFVSLVSALLESGLPKFHLYITDSAQTNRKRISELAAHARKTDPEVAVSEVAAQKKEAVSWQEIVDPFDSILYVSPEGNVEQLRALHAACRERKKSLLPALCVDQTGMAGPLVHPASEGCWESAWRRLERSALVKDRQLHVFSTTAGAMLANVIVFDLFKMLTEVTPEELQNRFLLLDLETLEGEWHPFLPHPLVNGQVTAEQAQDIRLLIESNSESKQPNGLLPYFGRLTSEVSGILRLWEEGNLKQLPLAQCRVQAADPLSIGPGDRLTPMICAGLTHEEARREAGLTGIEAYASRLFEQRTGSFIGVGTGETAAEGICRGLEKCLDEQLGRRNSDNTVTVSPIKIGKAEDERCRFYFQALTTMLEEPLVGMGEQLFGFPVMWVGMNGRWYGSAGLNHTLALRKALQQALMEAQNRNVYPPVRTSAVSAEFLIDKEPQNLTNSADGETSYREILQSALHTLKQNGKTIVVYDLSAEPFMKEELAGVYGVSLREEGSR